MGSKRATSCELFLAVHYKGIGYPRSTDPWADGCTSPPPESWPSPRKGRQMIILHTLSSIRKSAGAINGNKVPWPQSHSSLRESLGYLPSTASERGGFGGSLLSPRSRLGKNPPTRPWVAAGQETTVLEWPWRCPLPRRWPGRGPAMARPRLGAQEVAPPSRLHTVPTKQQRNGRRGPGDGADLWRTNSMLSGSVLLSFRPQS